MKTALSNIENGTTIKVLENGTYTEYIKMLTDEQGSILWRDGAYVAMKMNTDGTTVYDGCEADAYLINTETGFLSLFDSSTLAVMTDRNISTFTYGDTEAHTISRKCFLPSRGEVADMDPTELEPDNYWLTAILKNKNTNSQNTARKGYNADGTAVFCWLRSPNSASNFWYVINNGNINGNNATNAFWLRPALNFANATSVTDNGVDGGALYLDPTGSDSYVVEATCELGAVSSRPSSACVTYNATNLSNVGVYVCNNYRDANPVWVDATSQDVVELANQSKETDSWYLGVKLYGESEFEGSFDEPIVKYLTD